MSFVKISLPSCLSPYRIRYDTRSRIFLSDELLDFVGQHAAGIISGPARVLLIGDNSPVAVILLSRHP